MCWGEEREGAFMDPMKNTPRKLLANMNVRVKALVSKQAVSMVDQIWLTQI